MGFRPHCVAYKFEHTERTLVGHHTEFSLKLKPAYTLSGYKHEIYGEQPHTQIKMRMLKYSTRKGGELTLAVVAVEVSAVVLLVVDFVMHASAFRADIPVPVFRFHDEVYRIILCWELPEKFKLVHSPFIWLHRKGRDYNNAGVNFASSRNSVMAVCRYVGMSATRLKGIIPKIIN